MSNHFHWRHGKSVAIALVTTALLGSSAFLSMGAPAAQAATTPIPIHLFTFNDFHGRIDGVTTTNADGTNVLVDQNAGTAGATSANYGTAMNFAYTLETNYFKDPDNSMVVGAGDNIGASEFASAIANDKPTIDMLNQFAEVMNFKASTAGNHEFDGSWNVLKNTVINQWIGDSGWEYITANVVDKTTQQPVLPPYEIYTLGNGLKVAMIGATTQATPALVDPSGVSSLDFLDPVDSVNKYAKQLEALPASDPDHPDVIIAVYHEGSPDSGVGAGAADLTQAESDSAVFTKIVNDTDPGVSAIVTAHTHEQYTYNDTDPSHSSVVNGRPIIQTGCYGANVGDIELTYDPDTKVVTNVGNSNIPSVIPAGTTVADFANTGNLSAVAQSLADALATANVLGNQTVGKVSSDVTTAYQGGQWASNGSGQTTYQQTAAQAASSPLAGRDDRANESAMATMVANAFLYTANSSENVPNHNFDIGIINAGGGLRDEMLLSMDTTGKGLISYAEANAVLPFDNDLMTLSLTGAQFKEFLEEQWQTVDNTGTPYGAHPFLATGLSSNVTFTVKTDVGTAQACVYDLNTATAVSGQTTPCTWDGSNSNITSVWVNGQPLDMNKRYNILTISFLPSGGDHYRAMTQAEGPVGPDGVTTTSPQPLDTGLLDRDAWINYLMTASGMTQINGTPTKAVSPDYARQSVVVTNQSPAAAPMTAATVTAGQTVSATFSRLDLTSLGSPANTTLDTYLVPNAQAALAAPTAASLLVTPTPTPVPAASFKLGTVSVTAPGDTAGCTAAGVSGDLNPASNGCAKISYTIPANTPAGTYQLISIANPSGTVIRQLLTVKAAPGTGSTTDQGNPPIVEAGPSATVSTGGTVASGTATPLLFVVLLGTAMVALWVRRTYVRS